MRIYNVTKHRQCSIPEEVIAELGEELKKRYLSYAEVTGFIFSRCNKNWGIEQIMSVLEARGYLCTEERRPVTKGKKTFYKIMTKEDYDKIEKERSENVKRRLLAAVSC